MRIYTFRREKHVFESSDSHWRIGVNQEKKIATKKILRDVSMGVSFYDDDPLILSF